MVHAGEEVVRQFEESILKTAGQLSVFPASGVVVNKERKIRRVLVSDFHNYYAYYLVDDSKKYISIVRVMHTSRKRITIKELLQE